MKKEYLKPNMIVTTYVSINYTNADDGLTVRSRIAPNVNNDDAKDWTIYNLNQ